MLFTDVPVSGVQLMFRGPLKRGHATGFTLIELLVVFTLIALLLTIAVPRYLGTAEVAKEKVRSQNMATLRDALDKFKADQGRYPTALTELVDKRYLRSLPFDPITNSSHWRPLPDTSGADQGIYDIAPPIIAPASGDAPSQNGQTDALPR